MACQSTIDAQRIKDDRRNNAYRRGIRNRTLVMSGEDGDRYKQLFDRMCQEYEAPTFQDLFLIRQLADARWRLERLKGIETALLDEPDIDPAELERISGWQVRMETSYYKALKQLNAARKVSAATRAKDQPEEEPPRHPTVLLWKDPETGEVNFAPGFDENGPIESQPDDGFRPRDK